MAVSSCIPPVLALPVVASALVVDAVDDQDDALWVDLHGAAASACCPACGHGATRVHSTYVRRLADLAAQDLPVRLVVRVRRFRCEEPTCPRVTFVERLGVLAAARARRTTRLTAAVTRVGMALGGEAGARLLPVFGAYVSADTVLRLVHRAPVPPTPTPRVLGVDDWAKRRGHTYGTVQVGVSRATVRKNLRARTCPTRAPRRTKVGTLTAFDTHLRTRWQAGCRDAVVLWQELQARGFRGTARTVRRHVARWHASDDPRDRRRGPRAARQAARAAVVPPLVPPSPRQARWRLVLPDTRLTPEQVQYVATLTDACPPLRAARQLAVEFGRLLRARDVAALAPWLAQATASEHVEFGGLVVGLRRDHAAVEAAIRGEWSNGQTEGQVTKLKLLKRQMYGRASVALLRQRLLGTG